ncbi:hypothetical protein GN330_07050 [Nitratireductor sp. CAU 1489]|uniref:Uncharacterized protein n=1 Tax=Nitratireductor arenosus TaxID=2682096 RepID=A0A844QG29_9HYPH|nr:hypothetical protein [Nitratireductor arenosus]MVA97003.1 hypothetical protein [Nitratireductor arenosus]
MAATRLFRRKVALLYVLIAITLLAGCDALGFKNWEWRQKLVLEVETPTGVVSGGSVVAVEAGTSPKWAPGAGAGGLGSRMHGEASFVEVAPGRYLFALLGGGDWEREVALTLFFPEPAPSPLERAERLETMREIRVLPRERYPLLVTFTDLADPTTVRRVDPDDLAATFGPGVALKRVTLEITEEAVTEGEVEKVLGWLETIGNTMLDGRSISTIKAENRLANDLSAGSFATRR